GDGGNRGDGRASGDLQGDNENLTGQDNRLVDPLAGEGDEVGRYDGKRAGRGDGRAGGVRVVNLQRRGGAGRADRERAPCFEEGAVRNLHVVGDGQGGNRRFGGERGRTDDGMGFLEPGGEVYALRVELEGRRHRPLMPRVAREGKVGDRADLLIEQLLGGKQRHEHRP